MQENGHDAFSVTYEYVLRALDGSGMNPDYLATLKTKVNSIAAVLRQFHAKRRQLGDSGRYTRQGLEEAAADLAATSAGEIKRIGDMSGLLDNLRQVEAQLQPPATGDSTAQLLTFWKQMEIRSTLANQGIGPQDPVMAELAYRGALARGDTDTCQALEGWPLKCPVSPELVAQGQQQRLCAVNPVAAKKRDELIQFRDTLQRTVDDALRELPLPPVDEIALRAGPSAPPDEAA